MDKNNCWFPGTPNQPQQISLFLRKTFLNQLLSRYCSCLKLFALLLLNLLVVVFIFVKTHMHNTSFSFLSVYQCYFELSTIHPLVHLISCLHNQLKHNHNTFHEISSKFYLFKSFQFDVTGSSSIYYSF